MVASASVSGLSIFDGFLLRLGSPPSGIKELWFSCLGLLGFFCSQRLINQLVFQSFGLEHT